MSADASGAARVTPSERRGPAPSSTPAPPSTLRRAARVGRTLVALHVEVAVREAARDRKRIGGGVAFVVVGVLLFALLLVMLHIAAMCAVHDYYARPWGLSALVVAGVDLALCLLFLLVGRRRLRTPLMPETRSMIKRTVDALSDE